VAGGIDDAEVGLPHRQGSGLISPGRVAEGRAHATQFEKSCFRPPVAYPYHGATNPPKVIGQHAEKRNTGAETV
jgi:hypothetical protein